MWTGALVHIVASRAFLLQGSQASLAYWFLMRVEVSAERRISQNEGLVIHPTNLELGSIQHR